MTAQGLTREKLTPADDLREVLRQCELKVVTLKGTGTEATSFLRLMDEAQSLFGELEAKGIDLRAERARWETIEQQLYSHAALLVREIQTAGRLAQLRETTKPTPDRWWWFLDEEVRRQRQQAFKRMAVGGIVALLILSIAGLLYRRFLAPDPLTRQTFLLTERAERAIEEGQLEEALTEYEALRELAPDDAEVFLRLGVLYEALERDIDATQAYARAHALLGSQEDFFLERGMLYLEVGQWASARADGEAALALNPESALGYLVLAGAYEAQDQLPEAVDALHQAADLAHAQGNDTLYALIKIRLGVLMGGGGGVSP